VFPCLAIVTVAALLSSCARDTRKPVFPVRGQVFVNGKPAVGAKLFFNPPEIHPEAVAPYGVVIADGSFKLSTYLSYDGAPAGAYVVTIRGPGIKEVYNDPKTSNLTATVEEKPNELPPFKLTTK
jgi:hypothetical protein